VDGSRWSGSIGLGELSSSEFVNSGILLESFPLVLQGRHHHHQDNLAFTCFMSIHVGVDIPVDGQTINARFLQAVTTKLLI
jgi:hypothetical protein